jgi:hypothetical protein
MKLPDNIQDYMSFTVITDKLYHLFKKLEDGTYQYIPFNKDMTRMSNGGITCIEDIKRNLSDNHVFPENTEIRVSRLLKPNFKTGEFEIDKTGTLLTIT